MLRLGLGDDQLDENEGTGAVMAMIGGMCQYGGLRCGYSIGNVDRTAEGRRRRIESVVNYTDCVARTNHATDVARVHSEDGRIACDRQGICDGVFDIGQCHHLAILLGSSCELIHWGCCDGGGSGSVEI